MRQTFSILFVAKRAEDAGETLDLMRDEGLDPRHETVSSAAEAASALGEEWHLVVVSAKGWSVGEREKIARLIAASGWPFVIMAAEQSAKFDRIATSQGFRGIIGPGDSRSMLAIAGREAAVAERREAIRRSLMDDREGLLQSIFAHSREGISIIDSDYNLLMINPAMEQTHAANMPLLGKKCHLVYQRREQPCEFCPLKRAFETGRTVEGMVPGMNNRWLHLQAVPLFDKKTGRVLAVIEYAYDISEKKLGQQELATEKERLAVTLHAIEDAVVGTDREGRVTLINKGAEELTGWGRAEAIGRFYDEVVQSIEESSGRPAVNLVREILGRGALSYTDQLILLARDGTRRFISINGAPIRNEDGQTLGTVLVLRDITERRRAEMELARERDLLHTLMDCIPDFIYFKDSSCRYYRVNMAEAVNLGLRDPEAAVGKTVFDFFPAELAKLSYQDEQRIIRTGQPLINKVERNSINEDKWVLTTKVPVFEKNGIVTGIVGISRDITERMRAEEELTQSLDKLRRSMEGAIEAMALTVEIRDPYTAGHQRRVAQLACAIAEEMGLAESQVEGIRLAAAIHDIGKIYIPAEILSKPGRITETEFSMIRTHPQVGYDILKTIEFPWPIAQIVLQHHKRLDGSGYPADLPDGDILLESRILSVADVVEAMSSHRPYRPALGIDKALEEVSSNRGLLYDETVVGVCLKLFKEKSFLFTEAPTPSLS